MAPEPALGPQAFHLADPDARLPSGISAREAVQTARAWWNRDGRHVVRNPFWRDPDQGGIPSGIARGLEFELLTRAEQLKVVKTHHDEYLLKLLLPPDPVQQAIDKAAEIYRQRVKAGATADMFSKRAEKPAAGGAWIGS
jgi:hypothetical protein